MNYSKYLKAYLKIHRKLFVGSIIFGIGSGIALYVLPSSIAYHEIPIIFIPFIAVVFGIWIGTKSLFNSIN